MLNHNTPRTVEVERLAEGVWHVVPNHSTDKAAVATIYYAEYSDDEPGFWELLDDLQNELDGTDEDEGVELQSASVGEHYAFSLNLRNSSDGSIEATKRQVLAVIEFLEEVNEEAYPSALERLTIYKRIQECILDKARSRPHDWALFCAYLRRETPVGGIDDEIRYVESGNWHSNRY